MSDAAPAMQTRFGNELPYVGLRPFERKESDRFFGRDRDAQILCDRILSGRLTILYAQSGLGKSSLLRALVIPKLEASNARVVYFDAWTLEDPLRALREKLVSLAASLGVPNADRGSPTLVELVRLVDNVDDRSVVLVLDQFEEFLVHHGQALDPLRSELAALVRASRIDAAVVLSLREEFLAALEPFRQQVLNLFQSAYRLESLSEADLRDAICRPAEKFGGGCQPELAEHLIRDLHGVQPEPSAGGFSFVELPMLQLVCQELWKHAPDGQLSLALYERMGCAQRILDDYVRGLMPRHRREQSLTARLLVHLAPPSGLKMSYAVEDLATMTGLAAAGIATELERLSQARILRTHQYRGGERYVLEHDAFIPVLSSWRNHVLDRDRFLKTIGRMVYTALAVAAVTSTAGIFFHQKQDADLQKRLMQADLNTAQLGKTQAEQSRLESELARQQLEEWQTGGQVRELRGMPEKERQALAASRFDGLASYALWRKKGVPRLDELKNTLLRNQDLLPGDYALQTSTEEPIPTARGSLQLSYSSAIKMQPAQFGLMWRYLAKEIVGTWAIPVPLQVRLVPREGFPKERIRVEAEGVAPLDLAIPAHDNQLLIMSSPSSLAAGPAREFVERFQGDWTPFRPRKGIDWRLVPRWSLPVWKATGQTAVSPSGIAAYLAIQELLDKPEPFFSVPAVEALLRQARKLYPATIGEARAARGRLLGADLAARVRKWRGALLGLPDILDQLAESRATEAQARPDKPTVTEPEPPLSDRLRGPWPKQSGEAEGKESAAFGEDQAFSALESQMPEFVAIRVYVSAKLIRECFPGDRLLPTFSKSLEALRDDIYRAYGVSVPGFRFGPAPKGETLPDNAIRVDVQTDRYPRANRQWPIAGPDTLQSLLAVLRFTAVDTRGLWVTAETTQDVLKRLPPNMQEWLAGKYSLTDLKVLQRELMAPASGRPGATARYAGWTMSSLFFWALADRPMATQAFPDRPMATRAIRDRLEQVQNARLRGRDARVPEQVRQPVERGINALLADDLDTAGKQFGDAIKLDRGAAVEAFCAVWSRRLPEVWLRDFRRDHDSLQSPLARGERLDIDDLAGRLDPQRDAKTWSEISRYRLAAGLGANEAERAAVLRGILEHYDPREEWPTEHARWTAMEFLKKYDPLQPLTGDPRLLAGASALLKSAVARLDQAGAHKLFVEVVRIAQTAAAPNWSWRLLDELADLRPGGVSNSLPLELAWQLSGDERREQLTRALSLIGTFEKALGSSKEVSEKDRPVYTENVHYVRAKAYKGLARQGDVQLLGEAERLYRGLLASTYDAIAKEAHSDLVQVLYEAGRNEEAQALSRRARERWKDDVGLHGVELFAQVQLGREKNIAELAKAAAQLAKPGDDEKDWLYEAALGSMLAQSPGWQGLTDRFLGLNHHYRDYLLMMLYAYAGGRSSPRATDLLNTRWADFHPGTWANRMRNGDVSAWREMLIGRFLGKPQSARLLDILEHEETWRKSELSQLPLSHRGQRCEAWFYEAMRAKAEQQRERMVECLRRCVDVGMKSYYEHSMSVFLLSHMR